MELQKNMEEAFLKTHRDFIANLWESLNIIEKDINEAKEMQTICTDEWCQATESYLDELAKLVYSISEPRWLTQEDSNKVQELRGRVHNLYAKYKNIA